MSVKKQALSVQEQAEELVYKYLDIEDGMDYDNGCCINLYAAKQCALICVDEIILNGFNPHLPFMYWQKVKKQ